MPDYLDESVELRTGCVFMNHLAMLVVEILSAVIIGVGMAMEAGGGIRANSW